jgi:hypothetical protein
MVTGVGPSPAKRRRLNEERQNDLQGILPYRVLPLSATSLLIRHSTDDVSARGKDHLSRAPAEFNSNSL